MKQQGVKPNDPFTLINVIVVALVALICIVGIVALVLNSGAARTTARPATAGVVDDTNVGGYARSVRIIDGNESTTGPVRV